MAITKEKIQKILKMVAIEATESEQQQMILDLEEMVGWIERLKKIKFESLPAFKMMSPACDRFLEDPVTPPLCVGEALINAPDHDGAYFCVPPTEGQSLADL
ncbi:MAG: Asp-tRNA(Asn)/Glu-tRNA(Gln) amidotransferase subunit GatC [Cytophagales bacterium]